MATFTVRNVPEDAKHRFRQVAAAHGRSMEEHLRQLVIEADFSPAGTPVTQVADAPQTFRHAARSGEDVVRELIRVADGAGVDAFDTGKYAEIRFMTAKDAMAELRRLANGVGFDPPPRLSTELEAPGFLILVDTNVWSELTKPRGDPAVLAWLEANDDELALSSLVIAEIRYGIEVVEAAPKRAYLASWLSGLESRYYGQTLVFGAKAVHQYGRIAARPEVKARKPQVIDMLLAAQAREHAIPVATRNARDFEWIGVELVDPWGE